MRKTALNKDRILKYANSCKICESDLQKTNSARWYRICKDCKAEIIAIHYLKREWKYRNNS